VVPLLFELAMEEQFDETWLVTCNPMAQLQRLVERSGMTEGEARAWIEAQWSQERKLPLASRVLSNDATIADFKVEVLKTLEGVVNR
jgi:dephospho-CoA kinase